jgi:hypothetical protein
MWYVKSLELGPVPTLSMTAIVTSEGFGGQTKLGFGPPSDASLKKARAFGGKNYWEHMVAAERVALTLNRDEAGGPHSYLGVFRVSGFRLDTEIITGQSATASITIHEQIAVHDKDAPTAA